MQDFRYLHKPDAQAGRPGWAVAIILGPHKPDLSRLAGPRNYFAGLTSLTYGIGLSTPLNSKARGMTIAWPYMTVQMQGGRSSCATCAGSTSGEPPPKRQRVAEGKAASVDQHGALLGAGGGGWVQRLLEFEESLMSVHAWLAVGYAASCLVHVCAAPRVCTPVVDMPL
jgi:hypothetical protein